MRVGVFYHGTSASYALDLRKGGFGAGKKAGCTKKLQKQFGLDDPNSRKFHYVTSNLKRAAAYAKMHDAPEIVRMVLPLHYTKKDPQDDSEGSCIVGRKISKRFIFPKTMSNFTASRRDKLEARLRKEDIKVSGTFMDAMYKRVEEEEGEDAAVIERSVSPLDEEKKRDEQTMAYIQNSGGDFTDLKEGQAISISVDDLEAFIGMG